MAINLDADLRNADWLRTMYWDLPEDPEIFLAVIGGRDNLAHFMTLPAAEAMPAALAEALHVTVPSPLPDQSPGHNTPRVPKGLSRARVVPREGE